MSKRTAAVFLFFSVSALAGCTSYIDRYRYLPELRLHKAFETNFHDFEFPETTTIKTHGTKKDFPYVTFDRAWNAIVAILMQEGVIIRSLKDKGLIAVTTSPPMAFLIEDYNKGVSIYLYIMEDFYDSVDGTKKFSLQNEKCKDENNTVINCKKRISEVFFGKISTEIYADKKWQYLF